MEKSVKAAVSNIQIQKDLSDGDQISIVLLPLAKQTKLSGLASYVLNICITIPFSPLSLFVQRTSLHKGIQIIMSSTELVVA